MVQANSANRISRVFRHHLNRQEGYLLPSVLVVLVLAMLLLLPLLAYLSVSFYAISATEDKGAMYYAASAVVKAVMADMIQGLDPTPDLPATYQSPLVTINDVATSVSVQVVPTPVLMKSDQRSFYVAGNPTIIQGSYTSGSGDNLDVDDSAYYVVNTTGTPPAVLWEAVSDPIGFDSVSFVTATFVGQNDRGYVRVQFFVYNPDDPDHTDGGYNPTPDATLDLEESRTDYLTFFYLDEKDINYINSQQTKRVRMKVRAYRSLGDFGFYADQLYFEVAGVTAVDTRNVAANPTVLLGTYSSGSGADLYRDDTAYYTVSSTMDPALVWEATSAPFAFTALDTITLSWVSRASRDNITIEFYLYNPSDPAHTAGGYDTVPDLTIVNPTRLVDKAANLQLNPGDTSYINSLSDKVVKVKIRAYGSPGSLKFDLDGDQLTFTGTSLTAPLQALGQPGSQYIDPGVTNPDFAILTPRQGYLIRLHDVKAGLLAINWAYTPAGGTKVMLFRGFPVDNNGVIIPPGKITDLPPVTGNDLVVQSASRTDATRVGTTPKMLQDGVYTIVFWNSSLKSLDTKPFKASADYGDTWVWGVAYRDYLITATAGNTTLNVVVRATPGRSEPPPPPWDRNNVSWIATETTIMSWEPP